MEAEHISVPGERQATAMHRGPFDGVAALQHR